MTRKEKKYHLVYKTTNLKNGKIYIGYHGTDDKDDGYLGSGHILLRAIDKYGIENFKKEILFECDSRKSGLAKEAEIVDLEFIEREDTYNIVLGGCGGHIGRIKTKHIKTGEIKTISTNEYLANDDLVHIFCGTFNAKNIHTGEIVRISTDDIRFINGEFVGIRSGEDNANTGKRWYKSPCGTNEILCQIGEAPENWVLGRCDRISKEQSLKNTWVKGLLWFKNPVTGDCGRYYKGTEPTGWVRGRIVHKKRRSNDT